MEANKSKLLVEEEESDPDELGQCSKEKASRSANNKPMLSKCRMKSNQAPQKERKRIKIEAQRKSNAEGKKAAQATHGKDQLVQQPPVLVILEEYMSEEWFRTVVEEDDKEEVLYSCRMITSISTSKNIVLK